MFVSFLLAGRFLEMRARHRAERSLEDTSARLPQTALRVAADGSIEAVSAKSLRPGDRVRVPVGDAFAADGVLAEGATEADEALLSGESRPVPKAAGDGVIAGSVNLGAPVVLRVERTGADTRHEQIVALMRAALSQRPAATRLADRIAAPFLWGVLLLAAGGAFAWQFIDPSRALWVAVSVLIVTCPCALSLSAPAALLSATGALARRGVLLRRLEALETLADVKQVVLDKTGTLTEARPAWRGALALAPEALHERRRTELLAAAAALAAWSTHPLSLALAEAFPAAHDNAGRWHAVKELPGRGLEAVDEGGIAWRLGAAEWVGAAPAAGLGDDGLAVWFGRCGTPLLQLQFDEALRADAEAAVQQLQAQGLQLRLLSGDDPARVSRLAQRLGLGMAEGAATPEGKLAALRALQARGERVLMVGDGVNDAPVLAQADVSFAMGQGAAVARVHADAVLLSGRLADVAMARALARRTVRVIRQNLAWSALYNAACVPLAMLGWLPPWDACLGMAASSVVVVGNALRLARTRD
jgi:Cu2+-exporting ATPase